MKNLLTLSLLATAGAAAAAQSYDLDGSDWQFNYQGHYSIADANVSALGLTNILGTALSAQLALLSGTISSSGAASLNQSSASAMTTSHLDFDAHGGSLLLPAVKTLVYNAIDANDGSYGGSLSGSTLTLSKPGLGVSLNALGLLDTRVAGIGVVVDLRAMLPTNTLVGTIDQFDVGSTLPYGQRATRVIGMAGQMDTVGLQARVTTYTPTFSGIHAATAGYVDIGLVRTTADSWSLTRSPQAVPEPASMAALGFGAFGLLRRRRKVS